MSTKFEAHRNRLWDALQRDSRVQNKPEIDQRRQQADRAVAAAVAGYQVPPEVYRGKGFTIITPRSAWDVVNSRQQASMPSITHAEFVAAVRRGVRAAF